MKNKNTSVLVNAPKESNTIEIMTLLEEGNRVENASDDNIWFYLLDPPMPVSANASLRNWKHKVLDPNKLVRDVFSKPPPPDHISIVIDVNENGEPGILLAGILCTKLRINVANRPICSRTQTIQYR